MDFISRNLGTGRPQIQCTACGEYSHWSRACPYNNFCANCNDHSHTTHMCRAPSNIPNPGMCIYCGGTDHGLSNCCNKPWNNHEQPHPTPGILRNQQNQQSNTKILGSAWEMLPHLVWSAKHGLVRCWSWKVTNYTLKLLPKLWVVPIFTACGPHKLVAQLITDGNR